MRRAERRLLLEVAFLQRRLPRRRLRERRVEVALRLVRLGADRREALAESLDLRELALGAATRSSANASFSRASRTNDSSRAEASAARDAFSATKDASRASAARSRAFTSSVFT